MVFIDSPKRVRLKLDSKSIILLAGVQGAGKSSFATQNFSRQNVISSDQIFYKKFEESGLDNIISDKRFETIMSEASKTVRSLIFENQQSRSYTVLDSVLYDYREWQDLLNDLRSLYNNIILFVVQPDFSTIKKHLLEREKSQSRAKKLVQGMRTLYLHEALLFWDVLETDISSKEVGQGTDATYIIRDPKKTIIRVKEQKS